MRILGIEETSLVDWDGHVVSVLFLGGCNFRCPFCHNSEIAADSPELAEIAWADIAPKLKSKHDRGLLDGVCITGGEPLMHPEVSYLCWRIKQFGLKVKLDTNGYYPYPLGRLIDAGFCDAVAMDVKAPLNGRYSTAAGRQLDLAPIRRSIRLLMESGIEYEFRTTLVPGLVDPEDIAGIGEAVRGASVFTLQHFIPEAAAVDSYRGKRSYSKSEAESMAEALSSFVKEVKLRGKFL